jgi:hypothetical protein
MHEFWTILIANMTYIRSQNHTSIMVGEHGLQIFVVVVVVNMIFVKTTHSNVTFAFQSQLNV